MGLGAGWDVMQVIYKREGRITGSFVLARSVDGRILRKTDLVLSEWEELSNEDAIACQKFFDNRDKVAAREAGRSHDG